MPPTPTLPTVSGVLSASALLAKRVVRTPVLECPLLNASLGGGRLLLKAENLQTTGSFKYRGALHRLLRLTSDEPDAAERGVVAFSSGNFGQALAAASTELGIRCTVVSPHDAPDVKLDRIRRYGARLRTSTASQGVNREVAASALARSLADEEGLTLLHPFDDVHVVHGQGTIGVEFLEQAENDSGAPARLDALVVPCGGGGMTAGINLAVDAAQPGTRTTEVFAVEPAGYDDHARSFVANRRLSLSDVYGDKPPESRSVACDALMAGAPGFVTWSINGPRLAGAVAVPDDECVARAMKVAFDQFRLVLEPSGALGLAAVLEGLVTTRKAAGRPDGPPLPPGRVVGVIACGGNTDLDTYADMLGYRPIEPTREGE